MPPKATPHRGAASASSSTRQQSTTTPAPDASRNTATPGPGQGPGASTGAGAGTGPRQPVQRLQSLKKRTPAGSITPAAGRSSATPGAGVGAASGEQGKPTLKYKPRAVGRRSKEEREAIEKVEAERHRERVQEAAAKQRGQGDGPGGRGGPFGRGRGGQMGGSAGPLGMGMADRGGGARRGRGGGRFGGGAGGPGAGDSRATSTSRRSQTRSVIDMGSGAASRDASSDESDSGLLVDIDQINLDSDEEGLDDFENKKKKGKMPVADVDSQGEKSLRPIRVERREHEERVVSVNMESSSSKSAELRNQAKTSAKDDDALFVPQEEEEEQEQTEEKGVTTGAQQPRVKEEPTEDGDYVMKDVPAAEEADDELLPVQKVKVRRKLSKEPPSTPKDPKSLLRTKEDVEEYERHEQDLEVIKDLLFVEPKEPKEKEKEPRAEQPDVEEGKREKPETGAAEEQGEEKPAEAEELENEKLSGQLFLVQFPPMTPNLLVPGGGGETGEEPTEPPNNPETTTTTNEVQPTEPTVKRETDDAPEALDTARQQQQQPPPKLVTAADSQLPAGRVGKLNVHASGKVTLDWGGISFELDKATDVDFLQEVLILSTPPQYGAAATGAAGDAEGEEVKTLEEEEGEGLKRVWAMGQLSGKFTVTPDWEKIL